ncbi:hypothetical protein DAI22_02g049100 [Oryza sativa Japonica Group]|nr:hypothetical protein DAI22_02g049100 [Oryza sativa Japonica Group]
MPLTLPLVPPGGFRSPGGGHPFPFFFARRVFAACLPRGVNLRAAAAACPSSSSRQQALRHRPPRPQIRLHRQRVRRRVTPPPARCSQRRHPRAGGSRRHQPPRLRRDHVVTTAPTADLSSALPASGGRQQGPAPHHCRPPPSSGCVGSRSLPVKHAALPAPRLQEQPVSSHSLPMVCLHVSHVWVDKFWGDSWLLVRLRQKVSWTLAYVPDHRATGDATVLLLLVFFFRPQETILFSL